MKTKKYFKTMILPLIVSGVFMQSLAGAQENPQIQPIYSNVVQVNQAAQKFGDQRQLMAAETAMNNAKDKHVGMLSKISSVPEKDISDMRTADFVWSDVANELSIYDMTAQIASNNQEGIRHSNMTGNSGHSSIQHKNIGTRQMNSGDSDSIMESHTSATMPDTAGDINHGQHQGHGADGRTDVQGSGNGGMMSGAGGLGSDMESTDRDGHSGGMGNSGSGNHESGGHSGGGSDGGGHGGGGGGRM